MDGLIERVEAFLKREKGFNYHPLLLIIIFIPQNIMKWMDVMEKMLFV